MNVGDLRGRFDVPAGHPMLAGHFPGMPIAPGAWLLARAMEVLGDSAGTAITWGELASAKFFRTVAPGAALDVLLEFALEASVAQVTILEGETVIASACFRTVERAPCIA